MKFSLGRMLAIAERKSRLTNHNFSIISNTCIGGVISHSVGEQFRSPTVNMVIYQDDFIVFCNHLREYSKIPVDIPNDQELKNFPKVNYPLGILHGGDLPDIKLMFVHYKTFEEAKQKWEQRFKRVNYDDLFVIMDRGMEATEEVLDQFERLPFEHKVFFTDKIDKNRWKNNFAFSFYNPDNYETACIYNKYRKGLREYRWLDEFDYINWLNTGEIKSNGSICVINNN